MKTLQQVEPRTDLQATPAPPGVDTTNASYHYIINQPGSYYLSANLGVTKTNGIQITAEGVTLDLNGFEIARASGTGGSGIEIAGTAHRACVGNGSISGFTIGVGGAGLPRGCAFRDLAVSGCLDFGIDAGQGAVLEACRVHDNAGTAAIRAESGSALMNCTACNNTARYGILTGGGAKLVNCAVYNNTCFFGISVGVGSTLLHCSASRNGGFAELPDTGGILAGNGCHITGCSSSYNVALTPPSTANQGMGFVLGIGCTIQNSTAALNHGDGIRFSSDCLVRDNLCSGSGNNGDGAGIHATSSDNRLEGNHVSDSDRGFHVEGAGNVVVQNSATGNTTNYTQTMSSGASCDRTARFAASQLWDPGVGGRRESPTARLQQQRLCVGMGRVNAELSRRGKHLRGYRRGGAVRSSNSSTAFDTDHRHGL